MQWTFGVYLCWDKAKLFFYNQIHLPEIEKFHRKTGYIHFGQYEIFAIEAAEI